MLIVVKKGREADVQAVFDKWDVNCVQIGEVTQGNTLEYYMRGELVAQVPAFDLVLGGGAPVYEREYTEPTYFKEYQKFDINNIQEPNDLKEVAKFLAAQPNIASKRWVYRQYDSMVGLNNLTTNHPSDAAIIRLSHSEKSLAVTVDCNSRYVHVDPYKGGAIAVSEAARNIVCTGAEPVAITNCLNFGNPYNPEVYWQFVNAITGMGDACRKLETPVTGGNVSFYNQSSDSGPVFPTPTIGMLGILDKPEHHTTLNFKAEGHFIYLLGEAQNDINSSEYLVRWHKESKSSSPFFTLETEAHLQKGVLSIIKEGLLKSAHDISEGGLFINLLESAMASGFGFNITTDANFRKDAYLFGEAQSRVVVTISPSEQEAFEKRLAALSLPFYSLGVVTSGTDLIVNGQSWGALAEYDEVYNTSLEKIMAG